MRIFAEAHQWAKLSIRRRWTAAILAGALALGIALLWAFEPQELPLGSCAFLSITGHSCMTCGMTRSLHALLQGHLADSFRFYLLGPLFFAGISILFLYLAVQAAVGRSIPVPVAAKTRVRALLALTIVWLTCWGVRLASEFSHP